MERLTVKGFAWKGTSNFRNIGRWNLAECLNRLSEYEDTGLTPDEINAMRERDTAKVPEKFIIDSETKIGAIRFGKGTKIYRCPECGRMLVYQDHYCRNCGQRLKWEDWPCTES